MSNQRVSVDGLTDAVMDGLREYVELATESMKAAVKKAGATVQKEISAGAPRRTGRYAGSWRTKTTKESSTELEVTVYSPRRYMLAHLLENGHAKRGGGRVAAIPHIAPAEELAVQTLEKNIERELGRV